MIPQASPLICKPANPVKIDMEHKFSSYLIVKIMRLKSLY